MRNDIHAPSNLIPEDYEFVAFLSGSCGTSSEDIATTLYYRELLNNHMKGTGGKYSSHEHGGNCHICGTWFIHCVIFYHAKSNSYIQTGETCAEKLDRSCMTGFNAFKRDVRNAMAAKAGKKKAEALLYNHELEDAWTLYNTPNESIHEWGKNHHITLCSIVQQLIAKGNLSDKQFSYVGKLVDMVLKAGEREAAYEEKREAAAPVPSSSERVTFTGKIVNIKEVDDYYNGGVTYKVLVEHATGYRLYGTAPKDLRELIHAGDVELKGCVIQFNAKVTQSDKDEKFGFFSRPTKVEVKIPTT